MTPVKVRQLFDYNPDTGLLCWKIKKARRIKIGDPVGVKSGNRLNVMVDYYNYKVHILCWAHYYEEWPKQEIDHIDRNGLNNRITNLRLSTRQQNMANTLAHKDNKTGLKGVTFQPGKKRPYFARIQGRHIGVFLTAEEASAAYEAEAKKTFGEFYRARG